MDCNIPDGPKEDTEALGNPPVTASNPDPTSVEVVSSDEEAEGVEAVDKASASKKKKKKKKKKSAVTVETVATCPAKELGGGALVQTSPPTVPVSCLCY